MKSRILFAFCLLIAASAAFGYERLQGPTELLYMDPAAAAPGYVFFGVGGKTFLLDLDGKVVHT